VEIAVLGGGNGSFATAVDLVELGHNVRFWRRNSDAINVLQSNNNTITLKDFQGERPVRIPLVSSNIAEVINEAELIICPTPATAQADIARLLATSLSKGQVVWLPPGSFGSWLMARIIHDADNFEDISFAEAGTLPYLARQHGSDNVAITKRATRLPTGVFPLRNKSHALDILRQAYPAVEDAGDALSGALMNAGPIIHPPLIVMNAGPIEHFDRWDIHNEGRSTTREALGSRARCFALALVCQVLKTSSSPSTTNQIGVTWGAPFARTVASFPVLVPEERNPIASSRVICLMFSAPSCREVATSLAFSCIVAAPCGVRVRALVQIWPVSPVGTMSDPHDRRRMSHGVSHAGTNRIRGLCSWIWCMGNRRHLGRSE